MKKNKDYTLSSGNVFADLELPNPEELLAKAELTYQINTIIKQKKLTPLKVAKLLDVNQDTVSALKTGKLSHFSLEQLFRFLNLLGQRIAIEVIPKTRTVKKPDFSVSFPKIKKKTPMVKRPTIEKAVLLYAKKRK